MTILLTQKLNFCLISFGNPCRKTSEFRFSYELQKNYFNLSLIKLSCVLKFKKHIAVIHDFVFNTWKIYISFKLCLKCVFTGL